MTALFTHDQLALFDRSPLGAAWVRALQTDAEASRLAAEILSDADIDPASRWAARRLIAALHACLHTHPSPLAAYTRTLGSGRPLDQHFPVHLRELLTRYRDELIRDVSRTTPLNDPGKGVELLDLAQAFAVEPRSILFLGAAAGLELVGDVADPRFPGVPRRATDLNPLDVSDPVVAAALLGGCALDDEPGHERMRAGVDAARAARITVEAADAADAVSALPTEGLVLVCASTLLCSVDDAPALVRLIAARAAPTLFVSREAVQVHREAGHAEGLDQYADGDCVVNGTLFQRGEALARRSTQVSW